MRISSYHKICASALVLASLLSETAYAQEVANAGSDDSGLEEIVVTAEKREGNVQKTAIATDLS